MNIAEPQTVGVIGVGRMGAPICARLVAAGFDVLATDLRSSRRAVAVGAGARWCDGAGAVAAASEIVLSSLPGAVEVGAVASEVVGALSEGALWLEMSTASPRAARAIAAAVAERDRRAVVQRADTGVAGKRVRVLDAPVAGGPTAAGEGRLLSFVGGAEEDLALARPVLEAVTERIVHVGPAGAGYAVKLLANSLWFGQAVAVAEALALATRLGLDPERVRAALDRSAAASRFIAEDARALLAGDDLTTFSLARCCDQLDSVLELADELAVPAEVLAAVADVHRQALARYGEVDGELLGARFALERGGRVER